MTDLPGGTKLVLAMYEVEYEDSLRGTAGPLLVRVGQFAVACGLVDPEDYRLQHPAFSAIAPRLAKELRGWTCSPF